LRLDRPSRPTLFPYTTLFRSRELTRFCNNWVNLGSDSLTTLNRNGRGGALFIKIDNSVAPFGGAQDSLVLSRARFEMNQAFTGRSEEHTSELQSRVDLVCRLL